MTAVACLLCLPCCSLFYKHSVYVAGEMYSAPSIVLQASPRCAAPPPSCWLPADSFSTLCSALPPGPPLCNCCPCLHMCTLLAAHQLCVAVCGCVLQSRRNDGGVKVFDDFREAYAWLSHNTGERGGSWARGQSTLQRLCNEAWPLETASPCAVACCSPPPMHYLTHPFTHPHLSLLLLQTLRPRLPPGGTMATRPPPWPTAP